MGENADTDSVSSDDPCLRSTLKGHTQPITDIAFRPGKNQVASSSKDKTLMLWNVDSNTRSYSFTGHADIVTSVDFSSDGKFLATCSKDQTVRLWKPTIKGKSTSFKAHMTTINSVNFAPDSSTLITAANDKSIKAWSTTTKQFLCSYTGHNNWVKCARYSKEGDFIASCADDHTIRIWDPKTCQNQHTISSKYNPTHIDVHRNGTIIAAATCHGRVNVYDIRNCKLQQRYILHEGNANYVSWHPAANYLLSCGDDGNIIITDVIEGRPAYTLHGHEGAVMACKFSLDGSYFVSGGADECVMIWQTNFI